MSGSYQINYLKMKLILPILAIFYLKSVSSTFCFWNTGCPYKYFNSKTPYNFLRGDIRDSAVKLTDCEPISIWGLIREGKRNPFKENGSKMRNAIVLKDYVVSSYEKGNCSICAQDVENLQKWVVDENIFRNPGQLTSEGYQELLGLGRRLKQAFPKLLSKVNKGDNTFRPSLGKYTEDSAKGFVEGLGNKQFNIEPPKKDFDVMDPYLTCGKYKRDVIDNTKTETEAFKYESASEFLASIDRIQRRLGIDYSLTKDNITTMYNLCRYISSGLDNKFSPWCALFTTEDLKVLEYLDDLRYYYKNGYGNPMNELFGHIPMADLLKNFQAAKEGNGKKITAYFTHKPMMDMVYTSLKLFKDASPLTGTQRVPDRKWRTSKFSIFASNLIAVLNRCNKDGADDYNVVFYLNEEPLRPICQDGVCNWQEFEGKLSPFTATNTDFCEFTVPK